MIVKQNNFVFNAYKNKYSTVYTQLYTNNAIHICFTTNKISELFYCVEEIIRNISEQKIGLRREPFIESGKRQRKVKSIIRV